MSMFGGPSFYAKNTSRACVGVYTDNTHSITPNTVNVKGGTSSNKFDVVSTSHTVPPPKAPPPTTKSHELIAGMKNKNKPGSEQFMNDIKNFNENYSDFAGALV